MKQQAFEVDHAGMAIRGMTYRPSAMGRHPTVLLLHGFTGQRFENGFMFVQLARALVQRRIAAVTFDFRHSGDSDGSFDEMLVSGELADALRITEWVQGQPFVDRSRTGVLGFSLGGLVAACLCGRTDSYKSLALIAPTTPANLARYAGESAPGEAVTLGPHTLHRKFFDDLRTLDPLRDCVTHPRPTLLVHGSGDQAVPPEVATQFADAMRGGGVPLAICKVPDADHGFTKPAWRSALIEIVTQWTVEHLRNR